MPAFKNVSSRYHTHPVHQLSCGSIAALLVYNLNFLSVYHVLWVVFPSRTGLGSQFSNLLCGQYKIESSTIAQIWLDLVLPRAWTTSNQNILVFITKTEFWTFRNNVQTKKCDYDHPWGNGSPICRVGKRNTSSTIWQILFRVLAIIGKETSSKIFFFFGAFKVLRNWMYITCTTFFPYVLYLVISCCLQTCCISFLWCVWQILCNQVLHYFLPSSFFWRRVSYISFRLASNLLCSWQWHWVPDPLPLQPKCWNYKFVPPGLAESLTRNTIYYIHVSFSS